MHKIALNKEVGDSGRYNFGQKRDLKLPPSAYRWPIRRHTSRTLALFRRFARRGVVINRSVTRRASGDDGGKRHSRWHRMLRQRHSK